MESSRGLMRAPMTHAFRHMPAKMTFAPFQPKVSEMGQVQFQLGTGQVESMIPRLRESRLLFSLCSSPKRKFAMGAMTKHPTPDPQTAILTKAVH